MMETHDTLTLVHVLLAPLTWLHRIIADLLLAACYYSLWLLHSAKRFLTLPTMVNHSRRLRPLLSNFGLVLLLSFSPISATPSHQHHQEKEDEDSPITRFQGYLRINTAHPNPDYASAVSFLKYQALSIGLQTKTLEFALSKPLLLLTWPGSDPSLPSILLNSHLDSVPAEPSKWLHPPFSAYHSPDGKIFARGAQDDKCIAMQYLEAIRNLRAQNFQPTRTIHISYVPDEEIGGFDGAAKFAASKEFADLNVGFMLDEGQASTGDEFRVFYADRSPWNLIIKASGMPGHGSTLYDNSAMENLMKSVEIITKFRESLFDVVKAGKAANSEVISVNPVYLKAGIPSPTGFVMNMQPSEAEAGFDVRLPPTADPDLLKIRIAEEWAPTIRNMTYQIIQKGPIRDYMGRPLMTVTNDSNPWWSIFKQAITEAGGKLAKPEILASTTDARYMRQMGIPTLGFSPMKNTPILLHDHNEDHGAVGFAVATGYSKLSPRDDAKVAAYIKERHPSQLEHSSVIDKNIEDVCLPKDIIQH